jgi:urease accessory protein
MAQRVLYPDSGLPDQAWLFMITTSGCVLQGDRLALEVALGPGARAHVTTQSATKVHSMEANCAVQTQSIALADGAYLEFLPEPLIPHRRARFLSDTRISIAPTATLLYGEIVQPGRKHHHPDECFGATLLSLALGAERPDGRALFTEKLVIDPARRALRQTGVMGSFDVFANLVLLTPNDVADRIHARVGAEVDEGNGLAFGACRLPNDAGLIFKVLGRETAPVKAKAREFWAIVREEVTGTALPPPFFWR